TRRSSDLEMRGIFMSKRQSFYQFLMNKRKPDNTYEIAQFANNAFYDQSFPKQADDYDLLSQYLELNGTYLPSMVIFDNAWIKYEIGRASCRERVEVWVVAESSKKKNEEIGKGGERVRKSQDDTPNM